MRHHPLGEHHATSPHGSLPSPSADDTETGPAILIVPEGRDTEAPA
jgi:hypothetical protein